MTPIWPTCSSACAPLLLPGMAAVPTPKNPAMALMVEAAELQELFQWFTPEESQQLTADPAQKETRKVKRWPMCVLYRLQLADHTGVGLARRGWSANW